MFEFDTVSSSSPTDLARSLTQRSAEGWEVVSIVGSGLEMTAFLKRTASTTSGSSAASVAAASVATAAAVDEPAGWGAVPTQSSDNGWASTAAATPEPSPVASTTPEPSPVSTTAAASAAASVPTSATTTPSTVPQVPAGWYADPAGRYELRYWDGAQWTEHVARGGTQYTDPPVA